VVIICHSHYLAALAPLGLGALVSQCHFRPVNSPVNSRVNSRVNRRVKRRKYPLETSRYFGYNKG
jgi:hypothetical protein